MSDEPIQQRRPRRSYEIPTEELRKRIERVIREILDELGNELKTEEKYDTPLQRFEFILSDSFLIVEEMYDQNRKHGFVPDFQYSEAIHIAINMIRLLVSVEDIGI